MRAHILISVGGAAMFLLGCAMFFWRSEDLVESIRPNGWGLLDDTAPSHNCSEHVTCEPCPTIPPPATSTALSLADTLPSSQLSNDAVSFAAPSSSPYPLMDRSFSQRGWQKYAKLHAAILAGEAPPRYLISVAVEAGFGDRITGLICEFWFAFFSHRALVIPSLAYMPTFDAAFEPHLVNWTRPGDVDPPELIESLQYTKGRNRPFPDEFDKKVYHGVYHVNAGSDFKFLERDDLSNFPEGHSDVPNVYMISNRGRSLWLTRNPWIKKQLFSLGVRPETAFADAWEFLFRPSKPVRDAWQETWNALDDERLLKISINIRVGDHVFIPEEDEKVKLEDYEEFFKCAELIQKEKFDALKGSTSAYYRGPTRVLWFLTSDSLALRIQAKQKYADKIMTELGARWVHGDCNQGDRRKETLGCHRQVLDQSIQGAVGQLYAMAKCDYHIQMKNTGFARVSTWLSRQWDNIYVLDDPRSPCVQTPHAADQENWAGI